MSSALASAEVGTTATAMVSFDENQANTLKVEALTDKDETDVIAFLSRRPLHTVFMVSLIRDNGLVSPLNRGSFYGYRNEQGTLNGVALIGSKTVIEADGNAAFEKLGRLALANPQSHLIRGEHQQIARLMSYAERDGRIPGRVSDELLLVQTSAPEGVYDECGLRTATLADIEQVVCINAEMAFGENGVNPLKVDPEGVRQRMRRRVQQGRIWVVFEKGRIVFKADVISETPEVIFLEGIYVHPDERGRGLGFRCLTELGRRLTSRDTSLSLVVNQTNTSAQRLYSKSGYTLHSHYRTVYFQPEEAKES
jgi:ribosomal protein S18 acetylase RimI-like enzyme